MRGRGWHDPPDIPIRHIVGDRGRDLRENFDRVTEEHDSEHE